MLLRPNTFRKYQEAELTLHTKQTLNRTGRVGKVRFCWVGFSPGGVQRQQVDSSLQHRFEPQRQRERHLGWKTDGSSFEPGHGSELGQNQQEEETH